MHLFQELCFHGCCQPCYIGSNGNGPVMVFILEHLPTILDIYRLFNKNLKCWIFCYFKKVIFSILTKKFDKKHLWIKENVNMLLNLPLEF